MVIHTEFKELLLSLGKAISQCFFGIAGETCFFYHELVQIVTEEVGTGCTTMTVVDSEE